MAVSAAETLPQESRPARAQQLAQHESDLVAPLPETAEPPPGEMASPRDEGTLPITQEPLSNSPTFLEPSGNDAIINEAYGGLTGYLLGPGDQLDISIIGIPDLERNRIVLPDGTILLPLIGAVPAAGRTLVELEQDVTRRLSYYLVEPVVEVNLNTLRPLVVTVAGEVNRPGPVQLNSLSTFNTRVDNNAQLRSETTSPTLSTALVGAGGVKRTADLREITVRRLLPDGREVDLSINLWESIFEGRGESNILLQDGDVVFVPEAPRKPLGSIRKWWPVLAWLPKT
jgi:protein involved in polysaccharide export with SLBB domain